jgi:hypothetical protein
MNSVTGESSRPTRDRVKPSRWWAEHFRANRERDWGIPWRVGEGLDVAARRRIARSIAEFQRGESSEARNYLAKSASFSGRTGDPHFHATSVLFVREENGHAALLLRFMQQTGIEPIPSSWGDRVFRWLRGISDLGGSSRVLIVAELIAQEYYPALRGASDHPVLRRICDKIIADEAAHIAFQVERIVRVEAVLGAWSVGMRQWAQRILMAGTAAIVFLGHRRVFAGKVSVGAFLRRCLARNDRALVRIAHLRRERAIVQEDGAVVRLPPG